MLGFLSDFRFEILPDFAVVCIKLLIKFSLLVILGWLSLEPVLADTLIPLNFRILLSACVEVYKGRDWFDEETDDVEDEEDDDLLFVFADVARLEFLGTYFTNIFCFAAFFISFNLRYFVCCYLILKFRFKMK